MALTQSMDISDSREVIGWVEHPHRTFTFQVVHVSMHKIDYRNQSVMRVWNHNFPILAHMHL